MLVILAVKGAMQLSWRSAEPWQNGHLEDIPDTELMSGNGLLVP
jgi:hypothetical protein